MDYRELFFVKRYQRDFRERFGKTLAIDFMTMNGVDEEEKKEKKEEPLGLEEYLDALLAKYDVRKEAVFSKVRGRTGSVEWRKKVKNVLTEYSKYAITNRRTVGDVNKAASIVGRERSVIYAYAKRSLT